LSASFGCAKISGEPEAITAGNFPGGVDWPIRTRRTHLPGYCRTHQLFVRSNLDAVFEPSMSIFKFTPGAFMFPDRLDFTMM
jgi:hypothetical protein